MTFTRAYKSVFKVDDEKIFGFFEDYRFLSNYEMTPIVAFQGYTFSSVEHAYQAAKAKTKDDFLKCYNAKKASEVKKIGNEIEMREDWDEIKISVMFYLVTIKFQNSTLAKKLLDTGNKKLYEANYWNDTFWGVDKNGVGQNWLGNILMITRSNLRNKELQKNNFKYDLNFGDV